MTRSPALNDASSFGQTCWKAAGSETSRSLNDNPIGLVRGVVDGSQDVLAIEEGVIFEDFIEGSLGRKKLPHVGDAKALAANAGPPSALAVLDCDSVDALLIHTMPLD
jgi:hypothetical protein